VCWVEHLGWMGQERLRQVREATAQAGLLAMVTVPETLLATRRATTSAFATARQGVGCTRFATTKNSRRTLEACREEVDVWIDWFRDFYEALKRLSRRPTRAQAEQLRADFTTRMAMPTTYSPLGECVARTAARTHAFWSYWTTRVCRPTIIFCERGDANVFASAR